MYSFASFPSPACSPVPASAPDDWKGPSKPGLTCLFDQRNRLFLAHHDLAGDDALPHLFLARQRVHQVEHQVLDDHAQAARADLARQRLFGNRLERIVEDLMLDLMYSLP